MLGALVAQAQGNSAIAGAAGAATAEALAATIARQLYDKSTEDLNEAQKQTVVALSALAGGLAGGVLEGVSEGAVAGAKAGQNAVDNNEFGGRVYADRVFEAYIQAGGCGGAGRQQCRQDYENQQLANGGLEVAAAFALLPVAIVGAASTPAIMAAARAAVEACRLNPALCIAETTVAAGEMGVGEALPVGLAGAAGAKLTLEQAARVRVAQEVEQQTGQKLSGEALEVVLTGGSKAVTRESSQVIREVEVSSGSKGAWNKELNKPEPNTLYKVDGNKTYKTDDLGRVDTVEASLSLTKNDRNTYQQCIAGKCGIDGDEGGHLIASIFNGPGERLNILPMNGNLNKGAWKTMENKLASALKNGQSVSVKIDPEYLS